VPPRFKRPHRDIRSSTKASCDAHVVRGSSASGANSFGSPGASASLTAVQGLICAGTVWYPYIYGIPALILEAVRRNGSSCYHNGSTLCSLCGWFLWKLIAMYQMRFSSSKYTKNSFSAGAPLIPGEGAYDTPPDPLVGLGGRPLAYPAPPRLQRSMSALRLTVPPLLYKLSAAEVSQFGDIADQQSTVLVLGHCMHLLPPDADVESVVSVLIFVAKKLEHFQSRCTYGFAPFMADWAEVDVWECSQSSL